MRLSLFLAFVLFSISAYCLPASELDYGIMIDAGSTGSRIYLYEWPHRDEKTLPLVEPASIGQTVISLKNSLPISGFTANVSGAGPSLAPLINYVKSNFDSSKYSETPIYLKATAGMRALSQSDQDAIIANIRQFLHTTPFQFSDTQALVIPGSQEGLLGWVTVNYALQLLDQTSQHTYGALDMGGASTQFTFVPQIAPSSYGINTSLGNNDFSIYAYSYPLGQDASGAALLNGLYQDDVLDGSGNVLSPCFLAGYNETYNNVLAIGTGNFTACQSAVRKYLVTTDPSCASTCGIGNTYQPPIYGNYYAFSAFVYTNQFFNLSTAATIAQLRAAGQEFCGETYLQAIAKYPSQVGYLQDYCFTAVYFTELLNKYGFSDTSTQITTLANIGSIQLTWALGGMIYEANLLPWGGITSAAISVTISYVYTIALIFCAILML